MTPDALDRLRKRLRELAQKQAVNALRYGMLPSWTRNEPFDEALHAEFSRACSPDVILSLLDALDAREADAKDAARYRWLRSHRGPDIDSVYFRGNNDALDRAIDAALRGGKKPPYPEFCHTPDKCAGLGSCPRDPCCCD